jgi:hypothetical protein
MIPQYNNFISNKNREHSTKYSQQMHWCIVKHMQFIFFFLKILLYLVNTVSDNKNFLSVIWTDDLCVLLVWRKFYQSEYNSSCCSILKNYQSCLKTQKHLSLFFSHSLEFLAKLFILHHIDTKISKFSKVEYRSRKPVEKQILSVILIIYQDR